MRDNLFQLLSYSEHIQGEERGFTSVYKGFDLVGCHACSFCCEEGSFLLLSPVVDEVCVLGVTVGCWYVLITIGVLELTCVSMRQVGCVDHVNLSQAGK